jgi:hypothetical protein
VKIGDESDLFVLFWYGKALSGPFRIVCLAKDSNLTLTSFFNREGANVGLDTACQP